jgi:hypothetical protein
LALNNEGLENGILRPHTINGHVEKVIGVQIEKPKFREGKKGKTNGRR